MTTRYTGDVYLHAEGVRQLLDGLEEVNKAAWNAIRMLRRHRPSAAERRAIAVALQLALEPIRGVVPEGWDRCDACGAMQPSAVCVSDPEAGTLCLECAGVGRKQR